MSTLRPSFYLVMSFVALAVAFAGFTGTFFLPLVMGRFHAPPVVYIHGAILFGWTILFVIQASLISRHSYRLHKIVGTCAALAAPLLAASTVAVGIYAAQRDGNAFAVSSLLGVCTAMIWFLALIAAGVLNRRDGETHKRLMLLAMIAVLWPAWFRFRHYFPWVPRPDIWFALIAADSLIIVAIIRDWIVQKRVHPVWLFFGSALVIEQSLEIVFFDTPIWRAAAYTIFNALT